MSIINDENRAAYDLFIDEIRVCIALAGPEITEAGLLKMAKELWTPGEMAWLLVYALVRLADEVPMKVSETNGERAA